MNGLEDVHMTLCGYGLEDVHITSWDWLSILEPIKKKGPFGDLLGPI